MMGILYCEQKDGWLIDCEALIMISNSASCFATKGVKSTTIGSATINCRHFCRTKCVQYKNVPKLLPWSHLQGLTPVAHQTLSYFGQAISLNRVKLKLSASCLSGMTRLRQGVKSWAESYIAESSWAELSRGNTTLSAPILTMILEVTMNITKSAAFSNSVFIQFLLDLPDFCAIAHSAFYSSTLHTDYISACLWTPSN